MNYNYETTWDATTRELKFGTNIGTSTAAIAKTEPLTIYSDLKNFESIKSIMPPITMSSDDIKNMISLHIKDYQILCPDKVVRVDFTDNASEKMVLKDPDVFDIHKCLFIAIAKHLYKDTYTPEGIEYQATLLSYKKRYVKMVNNAIRDHEKKEKEKLLKLHKEKEEKERSERKRAKNQKRKEQLRKKRIEEQIEIQKEAIIRSNSGSDEDVKNG